MNKSKRMTEARAQVEARLYEIDEALELIEKLTTEMNTAAKNLDFERAMELRDILFELKSE